MEKEKIKDIRNSFLDTQRIFNEEHNPIIKDKNSIIVGLIGYLLKQLLYHLKQLELNED